MDALIQTRNRMDHEEPAQQYNEKVVHCITSLNRGRCALACMLLNVVFAFKYRSMAKFCIVMFGDDREDWKLIHATLWPAIAIGMLVVGSGGGAGIEHSMKHQCVDSHPDMPLPSQQE